MDRPPETETVNPSTADLDKLDTLSVLHRINDEDRLAASMVERALTVIAAAVDAIAERLGRGGCLHYFGAGTSGRLGVLDAAELPPTFSTSPDLVVAHIAGGDDAMRRSVEGAEDDRDAGAGEVARANIGTSDAVVGISASGRTPYVLGALRAARARGALTIALVNCVDAPAADRADIAIVLQTGAEALAGSTRMKAAAAQKMTLTAISTALMVRLGRVYGNLMVDVAPTNAKLRARAVRLISAIAGVDESIARETLARAGDRVKTAIVMLAKVKSKDEADRTLADACGSLSRALQAD